MLRLLTVFAISNCRYYAYVLDKQFEQQDMKIISGLSNTLRTDLVLSLHAATVERVPFLRHKHPQFIASVVLAFKLEFYGVDEYIIKQVLLSPDQINSLIVESCNDGFICVLHSIACGFIRCLCPFLHCNPGPSCNKIYTVIFLYIDKHMNIDH